MPNIVIEASHSSLIQQPNELLSRVNQSLWQSGRFKLIEDIKSRIYSPNAVLIGTQAESDERFIFVHFYLMSGRDKATVDGLAKGIADSIRQYFVDMENIDDFGGKLQICVNPIVHDDSYLKVIV